MATYLIDYENVKSEGIKGIAQLSEEDRVVIFYSHNADTITFEAMDMIFNSKAQVSKYKILCGGKNALDFQLSTYLGYLIHEAKDSYFYIISKDNGFKHVVDFWKRTFRFDGYVYCFATIAAGNARQNRFKNATAKERARAMEEELAAMSEELEAQGDSDLEESEEDSAPETKEVVKEVEVAGPRADFFQIGKSKIDVYGMVNIRLAAKILKANPDKKYKVAGYADKATGSDKWNQKLTEARAKAVYDALIIDVVS